MYRTLSPSYWAGLLCGLVLSWPALLWAAYTLMDLGPMAQPRAIASGTNYIAGDLQPEEQQIATLLNPSIQTVLGTLPDGLWSHADGVYRRTLVGQSSTGPLALWTHAFRWQERTGMVDLGTLGAQDLFSAAVGINGAGTIVGYCDSPDGSHIVACIWPGGGPILALDPLVPGGTALALAINEFGAIVGDASTADGTTHAVLWPVEGGIQDLQTLEGSVSFALGINRAGQVVGIIATPQGTRGFVWLPLTGMLLLPPLPGDTMSEARSINRYGTIVGRSFTPDPNVARNLHVTAVRWDNGQPVELATRVCNGAGWELRLALGVNDEGHIVGTGLKDGEPHGWRLIPWPPRCP